MNYNIIFIFYFFPSSGHCNADISCFPVVIITDDFLPDLGSGTDIPEMYSLSDWLTKYCGNRRESLRVIELCRADLHVQVVWTRVDLGVTYSSLWQSVSLDRDTKLNLCMTIVHVAKLGFRKK